MSNTRPVSPDAPFANDNSDETSSDDRSPLQRIVGGLGSFISRFWFLGVIVAVMVYIFQGMNPEVELHDGPIVEDFASETVEGDTFRLSDYTDDNIVVISLWATWCATCQQQMPGFMQLHDEFDDVQFVGLSMDNDGLDAVRTYTERVQSINYPQIADQRIAFNNLETGRSVPRTYVIDHNRQVRFRNVEGMLMTGELRPVLEALLNEERPDAVADAS